MYNNLKSALLTVVIASLLMATAWINPMETPLESSEDLITADSSVTHTIMAVPLDASLVSIQCGHQPCIIYRELDSTTFNVLMADGSTIFVKSYE